MSGEGCVKTSFRENLKCTKSAKILIFTEKKLYFFDGIDKEACTARV